MIKEEGLRRFDLLSHFLFLGPPASIEQALQEYARGSVSFDAAAHQAGVSQVDETPIREEPESQGAGELE